MLTSPKRKRRFNSWLGPLTIANRQSRAFLRSSDVFRRPFYFDGIKNGVSKKIGQSEVRFAKLGTTSNRVSRPMSQHSVWWLWKSQKPIFSLNLKHLWRKIDQESTSFRVLRKIRQVGDMTISNGKGTKKWLQDAIDNIQTSAHSLTQTWRPPR